MLKFTLSLIYAFLLLFGFRSNDKPSELPGNELIDSLSNATSWPDELKVSNFAWANLTPSPACLAVAATGEVYVGVDQLGLLGKTPDRGYIVKLVDSDNDGKVDKSTKFALADNPRGIISMGDKLFVLHTIFSTETKKVSSMDLVVLEDKNNDGIADGPEQPLIRNISSVKSLQDHGGDHPANGIRMGIDGWIYIAAGDFGSYEAVDRSGTKLTVLGGSVLRVRPDGTEMEVYTHGLRNIYDLAIDPYMNIFTRDNNNNGAGWNSRFSHHIQSGEYGYPTLFKNFTEEIIPPIGDRGGGASTGLLFIDEPSWPEKYNHVTMSADWATNSVYVNRLTADGPTYTSKEEDFIKLLQVTDLDVDGSGRLYMSSWENAGYRGNAGRGFIVRAVPRDWKYKAFPDLKSSSVKQLADLLKSNSAVARLNAQQELLTRSVKDVSAASWAIAADKSLPLYARVAGTYTYAQAAKADGIPNLVKLTSENEMREFALRALADRKSINKNVSPDPFLKGMSDPLPRVQLASIIGLGRLGNPKAIPALLQVKVPASFVAPPKGKEGPHAIPNSAILPAHIAVQSLLSLNAVDAAVKAVGTANSTIALWALRYMHDPAAVSGLINAYKKTNNVQLKRQILEGLSRLYKKEASFTGQFWWNNVPVVPGPYYKAIEWESSADIRKFLTEEWNSDAVEKQFFTDMDAKYQMGIPEFKVAQ